MNMNLNLSIYEALTEAGVKPDAARKVEREIESAVARGHEAIRAEMHEQLMTKADGLMLKNELRDDLNNLRQEISAVRSDVQKSINDLIWKLVSFIAAASGITLAAFKLLG